MISILVVDNRDSFVYNLVEYLRIGGRCKIDVVFSDAIPFSVLNQYDGILLSPGAHLPNDYPQMNSLIDTCKLTHSILGVCLGHQAIATYFGAELLQLKEPKHGHAGKLHLLEEKYLSKGLSNLKTIGRYHSWVVDPQSLPDELIVSGIDEEDNIMMIRHALLPIYGLQFHPESVITEEGVQMVQNWLDIVANQ